MMETKILMLTKPHFTMTFPLRQSHKPQRALLPESTHRTSLDQPGVHNTALHAAPHSARHVRSIVKWIRTERIYKWHSPTQRRSHNTYSAGAGSRVLEVTHVAVTAVPSTPRLGRGKGVVAPAAVCTNKGLYWYYRFEDRYSLWATYYSVLYGDYLVL